jgi:hypothetical protein
MNKFKNINGVLLLRELFWEHAQDKLNAVYTLKDQDLVDNETLYPSLYRLYMESNDPTEYLFALAHLDSWKHWQMLSQASFLLPYITRWREELELRFRANALATIHKMASTGGREAFQAAKYITEGNYSQKGKPRAGRPSKAQIEATAQDIVAERKRTEEDYLRLVQ